MARPFSLAFFLTVLLLSGCGGHAPSPGPADVRFVFADGGNIYAVNGDGSGQKKIVGGGYGQVSLSPDKTRMACVYEGDFYISVFNLNQDFETEGRPRSINDLQAVSNGEGFGKAFYPTWSPDGNKIYFLSANHLVVYDYQASHTTSLVDFPGNQSGGFRYEQGNLGLSKDGGTLYALLGDGSGHFSFWSVNLVTNQAVHLEDVSQDDLFQFKFPSSVPGEAVEALFGSPENPAFGPAVTPDGRYFFYLEKESGFFGAQHRLEGYDRVQKKKFDLGVISHST